MLRYNTSLDLNISRSVTNSVFTDIKFNNNTKIDHTMISVLDHYNVISIDRVQSKTKIAKDLWYLIILVKPILLSSTKKLLSQIKNLKNNHSFTGELLKYTQSFIKSHAKSLFTRDPALIFNDHPVHQVSIQKHVGMFLDCKLNFEEHLKTIVDSIRP